MVSGAYFEFDMSIVTGAIMLYSPGGDVLLTMACDDVGEVFGGSVYVSEVVYVEVCKCVVYVGGEGVPVCPLVISVGALGRSLVWAVECVCDGDW